MLSAAMTPVTSAPLTQRQAMKKFCASTVSTVLALAMSVALLAPASVRAATLIVSNTSNASNGNTATPDTLNANPGADGISLVEAVAAVAGSPGPHTITFA